ncbi:MAG: hypothetical protein PVG96_19800, partial [Desulfobacterales bacterium]
MTEKDNLVNLETQGSIQVKNTKDSAFSFPGLPKTVAPSEAYTSSDEHLWDELSRIDLLVRAQTILWRQTIAAVKPQRFWGMAHISDKEVDAYLRSSFTPPYHFATHLKRVLERYWNAAEKMAQKTKIRVKETSSKIDLRLRQLKDLFKLSRLELDILLVVLLSELDERYRRLFGYLLDDASKTQPTVDLVLQILYPVMRQFSDAGKDGSIFKIGRSVFNSDGNLSQHYLIQLNNTTQMPESISLHTLHLNERVSGYLLGNDTLDRHLVGVTLFPFAGDPINRLHGNKAQNNYLLEFARWWKSLKKNLDRGLVLYLHGQYGSGRLKAALTFCREMESDLLLIDSTRVLDPAENWEQFIDLCYREASLRSAALCWLKCERYLAEDQPQNRWNYLVRRAENASIWTFFSGETVWNPTDQFQESFFLNVDFAMPDYEAREEFWQKHLPPDDRFAEPEPYRENLAPVLATSFQLTEGQIVDAIATAERVAILRDIQNQKLKADDLYAGCRRQSSRRLINLAQRIEPYTQLTFDNLILPRPNRRQLEELRTRICYQCKV